MYYTYIKHYVNVYTLLAASANSETNELETELSEERQRSSELQQQLDSTNARLAVSERNLQQVIYLFNFSMIFPTLTRK